MHDYRNSIFTHLHENHKTKIWFSIILQLKLVKVIKLTFDLIKRKFLQNPHMRNPKIEDF